MDVYIEVSGENLPLTENWRWHFTNVKCHRLCFSEKRLLVPHLISTVVIE